MEVAVTYNPMLANTVGGYGLSMQGASVQVHGQFFRGWGVVADVSGLHASMLPHSMAGLDLVTADFGPRYTWLPVHHRLALFGQFLVGEAFGMNSIFPSAGGVSSSANGLALQVGGGMNLPLSEPYRCARLRSRLAAHSVAQFNYKHPEQPQAGGGDFLPPPLNRMGTSPIVSFSRTVLQIWHCSAPIRRHDELSDSAPKGHA